MNELIELTFDKTMNELTVELALQIRRGESKGGTVCSHIISEINNLSKNLSVFYKKLHKDYKGDNNVMLLINGATIIQHINDIKPSQLY